jgi:hypothetical protein
LFSSGPAVGQKSQIWPPVLALTRLFPEASDRLYDAVRAQAYRAWPLGSIGELDLSIVRAAIRHDGMIFVDLEQKILVGAQIHPLLERVQELIPICSEDMVSLVDFAPQRITPLLRIT